MSSLIREGASSSFCRPIYTHGVFLSFRGPETRNSFTAHLYKALTQKGISAYKDDVELQRGTIIEPALWQAIEESRFSVVIFSKGYASSSWCLDELVQIVQCMKKGTCTVLPVFYDVDPSEVAEIDGGYNKAFPKHRKAFRKTPKRVQIWRESLKEVANVSGWDVRNRNEADVINQIVEYILYELSRTSISSEKDLVGLNSPMEEMEYFLNIESNENVRFIGIWGMGGIGKTTIARAVFYKIRSKFEASCFLANIRVKREFHSLQEQLLSHILLRQDIKVLDVENGADEIKNGFHCKKLLVVLDDVEDSQHLKLLAGGHDWFGGGSRIIITSRDKDLLKVCDGIYEVKKLKSEEALTLLSMKAFMQNRPPDEYLSLSMRVVKYSDGLPLAIRVLGTFLSGRRINEWKSAVSCLDETANIDAKILDVLMISFDELKSSEKQLFLDIACFFNGMDKKQVTRILESGIGLQVLIDKCLVSVEVSSALSNPSSKNEHGPKLWVRSIGPATEMEQNKEVLRVHGLLQVMAKKIVHSGSLDEPGKCSRIWSRKDFFHLLMHGKETNNKVKGIVLNQSESEEEEEWNVKVFPKMCELTFLSISNVRIPKGPEYLSEKLRFLEWSHYPSKSLPSDFQPINLLGLYMKFSSIEQLWYGVKCSSTLLVIDLSFSKNLIKTPDFTGTPNLQKLILRYCKRLSEVHKSLASLEHLVYVDLECCYSLSSLPSFLRLESLEVLILRGCKNLSSLPKTIYELKSLKTLDLSKCFMLKDLPENLGRIEFSEKLDVSGIAIEKLPRCLFLLKHLKELSFRGCKGHSKTPWDWALPLRRFACPQALKLLSLSSFRSLEKYWVFRPKRIASARALKSLSSSSFRFIRKYKVFFQLKRIPSPRTLKLSITSFKSLEKYWDFPLTRIATPRALKSPCFPSFRCLEKLDLSDRNLEEGAIPDDFFCYLLTLRELNLSKNNFSTLARSIGLLSKLDNIELHNCKILKSIHVLPSSTKSLNMNHCTSLEEVLGILNLLKGRNKVIYLLDCYNLYKNSWDGMALEMVQNSFPSKNCCNENNIERMEFVIPGSKIPSWFHHQSEGSTISLRMPATRGLDDYNGCIGLAVCASFRTAHKSLPCFKLCLKRNGMMQQCFPILLSSELVQLSSCHLWLLYEAISQEKTFLWSCGEFAFDELAFEPMYPNLEITHCGIQLVTQEDIFSGSMDWN